MTSFILFCVENTILPIASESSELDEILRELKKEQQSLRSALEEQLNRLSKLCLSHAEKQDESLKDRIIEYLQKTDSTNEYVIASDLELHNFGQTSEDKASKDTT